MIKDACSEKHTKFQIPDKDWCCPKCPNTKEDKARSLGAFVVEDGPNLDCGLIHNEDLLNCYDCEYAATGVEWSKLMLKRANQVPCKHCKGTGIVAGKAKITKKTVVKK